MAIIEICSKMFNLFTVKGKETLDGYRNLNLIANAAPECVRPVPGAVPEELCLDCVYFGPGINGLHSRALLVDCLIGKIKSNEQRSLQAAKRSLQATKRSLQNARTINQLKKR